MVLFKPFFLVEARNCSHRVGSHHCILLLLKRKCSNRVSSELAQGSKTAVREKVNEFSLMCRGFHGTLYTAETS